MLRYKFKLKRALSSLKPMKQHLAISAEQIELAERITKVLLVMLCRQLLDQVGGIKMVTSFELFELCDELCDQLGLRRRHVVMLDLMGEVPELIWDDHDLNQLRGRLVDDLRRSLASLVTFRPRGVAFRSIIVEKARLDRRAKELARRI